jgi:methionyl-tRNA formyltransferase
MRVVMMGTGTFAEPTLDALLARPGLVVGVVTQPDREVGNRRGSTRQVGRGIKSIATEARIPVLQPTSINTPDGIATLRELRPDLLVVVAYGQILSPEVLAVPALGGINVHASLLPKYRGAAPVAWAIWKGETQTGVSIIRMSAGLDAGEILAREAIDILADETAGELEARLAPIGAQLALDVVDKLKLGPVGGTKQDASHVTKAPKLKKEMGLIDWSKPAPEVWNQIRAMQPWPTPYTFLHRAGQPAIRLQIIDGVAARGPAFDGNPGDLRQDATEDGDPVLLVLTGEQTVLRVLSVQPAGKRQMTAAEFLRGRPVQSGDRFGPENV